MPSLTCYLRRLRTMSAGELAWRTAGRLRDAELWGHLALRLEPRPRASDPADARPRRSHRLEPRSRERTEGAARAPEGLGSCQNRSAIRRGSTLYGGQPARSDLSQLRLTPRGPSSASVELAERRIFLRNFFASCKEVLGCGRKAAVENIRPVFGHGAPRPRLFPPCHSSSPL